MRFACFFVALCVLFCTLDTAYAWNLRRMPHQVVRGWFTHDPFVSWSNCSYTDEQGVETHENYTRAMVWDCLLEMGDANNDGILSLKEIEAARNTHLNWKEKLAAPYAQGLIDDCSTKHHQKQLNKATFMASTSLDCAGTEANICRVHSVCMRELAKLHANARFIREMKRLVKAEEAA